MGTVSMAGTAQIVATRVVRMRRRPSILVVCFAGLSLAAAACSGSDGSAGGDDAAVAAASVPAVPSAGCGGSAVGATELERREVAVTRPESGEARWFLLSAPTANDGVTPLPLVVDFHGLSEGASIHAAHSNLSPFAEENDFVVAFPNGTGTPVRWNILSAPGDPSGGETPPEAAADLAFVDAMLDQIEADLCIDRARIYATGLSNGAGMTSLVGCERANRFAAIAPVAGVRLPEGCGPTPTPMVAFHGTLDPILFYNGGVGNLVGLMSGTAEMVVPDAVLDGPGYPAAARAWAAHNGCEPEPEKTRITSQVEHWVFDCPQGGDVEFYAIEGGGHTWPGSQFSVGIEAIAGPTTFDIDANEVMWAFFSRHARS
jgi:polyhydroxybutyrate depolymerase